jgi:hypothetical protein
MISKSTIPNKDPERISIELENWKAGTINNFNDTRRPNESFGSMKNAMLYQDGVPGPRPGTASYGTALAANPDGGGSFTRYNTDGTKTIISVMAAGGHIYYSTNDMVTWIDTGATYTSGTRTRMIEFNSGVYIYNGIDALKVFNMTSFAVTTYASAAAPASPSGTRSGTMTAGSYNNYYMITATNSVGETTGSTEVAVTTSKLRETWTNGSDFIDLTWSAVSGSSIRYNIYYSDATNGEVFLDSVTGTSYRDSGQTSPNPYVVVPIDNTTSAPKFDFARSSEGKLFGIGDPTRPYRIYWTGTGTYAGYFSPFFGGGYIDLDLGGPEIPRGLIHFRTGQGSSAATVFTTDASGDGSTWHVLLTTSTVGDLPIIIPQAVKVTGSAGTNSPDAIFEAKNSVIYPSTQDIFAIGSKPQLLNLLATDSISPNIRPWVKTINNAKSGLIAGIFSYGNAYITAPVNGSTVNNATIVLNLELGGWSVAWDVGFKYFFKHVDATGKARLLAMPTSGGQLVEINESYTNDKGTAFESRLQSGLIHFSKDHLQFIIADTITFEFLNPRGSINISVSGTEFNKPLLTTATATITDDVAATGWGYDRWASIAWGNTAGTPVTYTQSVRKKEIPLKNKMLNNIAYEVYSSSPNQQWFLSRVVVAGYPIRVQTPSSWRQ